MKDIKKQDEFFDEVLDDKNTKLYNFMINASNQANLANDKNISPTQLNAVFVLINPYYLEEFNIEGLDLRFTVSEEGVVTINNKDYEMFELGPGIKIFGISKQEGEC